MAGKVNEFEILKPKGSWNHFSTNGGYAWQVTSSTYGDPVQTGFSQVVFHERENFQCGTVTGYGANSGPSAKMGLVFTPTVLGRYLIKFSCSMYAATVNDEYTLRLMADSTVIDESPMAFAGPTASGTICPASMEGIINVTSLAPITIKVNGAATAGLLYIPTYSADGSGFSGGPEWSIVKI